MCYALYAFIAAPILLKKVGLSDHAMCQIGTWAFIVSKIIIGSASKAYLLFIGELGIVFNATL